MTTGATVHRPVLLKETLEALMVHRSGRYIDANLGGGGHTEAILTASSPDGIVLGIDADAQAIAATRDRLAAFGDRLRTFHGSSARLSEAADAVDFDAVDGVIFDLGLSSDQLVDQTRGFGIRAGGTLDFRFDVSRGESAADLLALLDVRELQAIFRNYGEEPHATRVARAIVAARATTPITTSEQLSALVEAALPKRYGPPSRIHPATRVFQALRIAVNDELGALRIALAATLSRLSVGGRVAVLTYHSLEDRIVKQAFAAAVRGCICPPRAPACACGLQPTLRLVNKKPITASPEEIAENPRSRSAKLRVAERLAEAA